MHLRQASACGPVRGGVNFHRAACCDQLMANMPRPVGSTCTVSREGERG